jgi:hypothetical protein
MRKYRREGHEPGMTRGVQRFGSQWGSQRNRHQRSQVSARRPNSYCKFLHPFNSRYPRKPVNTQTHIQDFLAVCSFAKAGKVHAADVWFPVIESALHGSLTSGTGQRVDYRTLLDLYS